MAKSFLKAFCLDKLQWILGLIGCVGALTFIVVSIPVYLYRGLVIMLAKGIRKDLGEILNGQSAIFVVDYFYDRPPRSMCNGAYIFEGQLTFDLIRERVQKTWIGARNSHFEKFQQHPVNWLGFTFWKDCSDSFLVDKHVFKLFGDKPVTHDKLTVEMERLVNRRIPRDRSPWEIYVIENYISDKLPKTPSHEGKYSVILFNMHHCLMDGTGVLTCLVDGVFEGCPLSMMNRPKVKYPKRSLWQGVWFLVTFPFYFFTQFSYLISHFFRSNPLKISDNRKDWYHVAARSEDLIPVQLIKDIKNQFGVTFTSVLLSAISAAVHRILKDLPNGNSEDTVLCLSMLPAKGTSNRSVMANHMTGAVFDLPIGHFDNPIARLKTVDRMLEKSRNSVMPYLSQCISTLCGAHLFAFNKLLVTNKMIPISLSNFAGVPDHIEMEKNVKWVMAGGICGGFEGDTGLFIVAGSHGPNVGIEVTAERAVMSREQTQQIVAHILQEIETLRQLMLLKANQFIRWNHIQFKEIKM